MSEQISDLISITLHLKLKANANLLGSNVVPSWWGRASQQLLLSMLSQPSGGLNADIHDHSNSLRPYTASTLFGYSKREGLQNETVYRLRFTGLRQDVSACLTEAIENGIWSTGSKIFLDRLPFEIVAADSGASSITNSYIGLSEQVLSLPNPSMRISLQLLSPTFFKSHEQYVPFPLPGLVFGSLVQKWNIFSPIKVNEDLRLYAEECLAISRYQLATHLAEVKGRSPRPGAMGTISYAALNDDPTWLPLINTLASFSFYAGLGAGTTTGMGQCAPERNRAL